MSLGKFVSQSTPIVVVANDLYNVAISHVLGDHDFSKCFMFVRFSITKSISTNEDEKKATLARFALAASPDRHKEQKK